MALSSIASASRFFSLTFSSSSDLSRLHRPLPPRYSDVLLFREPARLCLIR